MEPRPLLHDARGEGEPIVLVPGGLTGWLSWIPHQERLAERYRAIRVQPIHNELGSAGKPGDPGYTHETERESLRLTLDVLGLQAVHLVGWSGGGRAALEFATEYPARVHTLTLVEPAAQWVPGRLGDRSEELERSVSFVRGLAGREVTEDDLAEFLVLGGLAQDAEAVRSQPVWERWLPHRMALSWQSEALDDPGRSVDELSRIICPVMLVKGTRSTDLERHLVDVLGEHLPNTTIVELAGDHASHIESIDDFLEAFERHVRNAH